jgi:putative Mn2+ efflux pump MntP
MWALLALSVGLAMDAVAVSASAGLSLHRDRWPQALRLAVTFGFFQCGMAVLGGVAGGEALRFISDWDHWIAFGLLAFIGGKMIREGFREDAEHRVRGSLTVRALLILGVATSIDSLAAGFTLPVLELPLAVSAGTIGLTTFVLSLVAALLAQRLGESVGGRLEVAGGLVLIAIGLKILLQHLGFSSF